jgi:hypothetical protein
MAAGFAALAHASPAHALGAGVEVSQTGSRTIVTVKNALTITKPGTLSGVTNGPFDLTFELDNTVVADAYGLVPNTGGLYAFEFPGTSLYPVLTSTTSNFISGTYLSARSDLATLFVYSNGRIDFTISSSNPAPAGPLPMVIATWGR